MPLARGIRNIESQSQNGTWLPTVKSQNGTRLPTDKLSRRMVRGYQLTVDTSRGRIVPGKCNKNRRRVQRSIYCQIRAR